MSARDPRELFSLHETMRTLRPEQKSRGRIIALWLLALGLAASISFALISSALPTEMRLASMRENMVAAAASVPPLMEGAISSLYRALCPYSTSATSTFSGNLAVNGTASTTNFLGLYATTSFLFVNSALSASQASFGATATSSFSTAGALTLSSPLSVSSGGTGWASLAAGYIPFGNGLSALATSSSLFWDNSTSRLGVGLSSPSYSFDVGGFINTSGTGGGYKQSGNTILYASTTNNALAVGASSAATWMRASSTQWYSVAIGAGALATTPLNGDAGYMMDGLKTPTKGGQSS